MLQRISHIFFGLFFILLLTPTSFVAAQDIVFNHLLSAPQYTNPAFVGTFGTYHASAAVRSQYTASTNIGNTIYADFDTYVSQWDSGLGAYIMNDRSSGGIFQTTSFGAAYSYAFRLSENIELRPALQAVFYLSQFNSHNFIFPDDLGTGGSTLFPNEQSSKTQIDFSAGLLIQHPQFVIGGAVQHIGASNPDSLIFYGDRSLKITLHGQASILLSGNPELLPLNEWSAFENLVIVPQAKFIHQSDFQYLVAGAAIRNGGLFAGLALKTPFQNQTFLGSLFLGLESTSLKIGYNFDFLTGGGNLRGWNSGSHEIFIHYSFGQSGENTSSRGRKLKSRIDPACNCPY